MGDVMPGVTTGEGMKTNVAYDCTFSLSTVLFGDDKIVERVVNQILDGWLD